MKEHVFTDILRLKNLKIRNENLIKQLSKDELIYLHLHLMMKDEVNEIFKEAEIPLSLEDFEKTKKNINIKRLNRDRLIEDIINIIKEDEGEENWVWFRMDTLENPALSIEYSEFYLLFYSLLSKQICAEFEKIRTNTVTEYTSKLSSFSNENKSEYNCIKSVCALYLSDKYFNLKERADKLIDGKKNKKAIESAIFELQQELAICVHNNYAIVCGDMIDENSRFIDKLKADIKKSNSQIEDKNLKIKELKEDLKQSNKQNKELQKLSDISSIENSIKEVFDKVKKIESSNSIIEKELKSNKESILKQSYEKQIDSYITKLSTSQSNLTVKSNECKELQKELDNFKRNIEDKFIDYVEENGLSDKMREFLRPLFSIHAELVNGVEENKVVVGDETDVHYNVEVRKEERKIGYVTIEDNKHFVNFANGSVKELLGLSDKIYLADGQFIIVDEDNNFIKTTASVYEDNGISIKHLNIGTVESTDPLSVRIGFELVNARSSRGFVGIYNSNQAVALNDYNQIVRAFKMAKFNADTVIKSVKARGQEVFYVLDVFRECLSLRNIETGYEDIYKVDIGDFEVNKSSIVFIKDNTIVNVLNKSIFYTSSSFYNGNVEFGPISINGDIVLLKKQNGEQVIVKNIPETYTLSEGQIIYVDEFNNFMYVASSEKTFVERVTLKKPLKQIVNTSGNRISKEIKGDVVIVGNPYYKNGYIAAFYKCGYRVKMLHGYDCGINKIIQEAKDSVAIIVNTSYCSHDNFWQIKDEVKEGALSEVKYIFTQDDGANMLLNRFLKMEADSEVAITN